MKTNIATFRILGALAAVWLLASCSPPAEQIKAFTAADKPIAQELAAEGDAWSVTCEGPRTCCLFEVPNPELEQCVVFYRAALKAENLQGRAYIEMWCRFPGRGEFFSKGLDQAITGTKGWTDCQTPFFLKQGEKPDLIKLNLVVEGRGKVWIKNVALFKAPLR